ncbi:MAG: glycosyltransferase family 4 protein [Burkholderiales bacterium]|nr:glycosyltransferase family 4 protein [Burkholderiales bacterium]
MPFVVASLPGRGQPNPYVDLFYDALLPHGITLVGEPQLTQSWGSEHFSRIDAIHLHWPEYLWRDNLAPPPTSDTWRARVRRHVPGAWRILGAFYGAADSPAAREARRREARGRSVDFLMDYIDAARAVGVSIFWTAHNLESHEGWDDVDERAFSLLAERADLVICHSRCASADFTARYGGSSRVVVMPHGNYDGVYPDPRPRAQVLGELGLDPERPTVGCVGAIRGYKGIDLAVEAVRRLDGRVQMLCAGKPRKMAGFLESFGPAGPGPGFALVPRALGDQEFADYSAACDLLLLPYRRITGSGALLAALTFGRAVVTSDLPYFREMLRGDSAAGCLSRPGDSAALADSIVRMLQLDAQTRAAAARALADEYAWPKVVVPVVEAIRSIEARRAGRLGGAGKSMP